MSGTMLVIVGGLVIAALLLWWLIAFNSGGASASKPIAAPPPGKPAVEPIAVVAPIEAVPVIETPAAPAGPVSAIGIPLAQGEPDDLRRVKGIGPKLANMLTALEITRYDQIAAWGPGEIATVDTHLGTFKGRITRDNWVEQCGYLASGDIAGFETKFGKLDPQSK